MSISVAILTISTRGSSGERSTDVSGDAIKQLVEKIKGDVVEYKILPDDKPRIITELRRLVQDVQVNLILTTGGTGLSPNDVTPEATLEIIERRIPGIEEVMRMAGFRKTPFAVLSRAVAGTAGKTLIVNLPGNPKGVRENLEAVLPVLPHAIKVLSGGKVQDREHDFKQKS